MEPLLRGHADEKPNPLETPLDNVNLNINVLNSSPHGELVWRSRCLKDKYPNFEVGLKCILMVNPYLLI